jgi:hypothetical protein
VTLRGRLNQLYRPVIVAMVTVRVMHTPINQIIYMVRHAAPPFR